MAYLRGIRKNERVYANLETLPIGTIIEDVRGKKYTRDRFGWSDTEDHPISVRTLDGLADWVLNGVLATIPGGHSLIYPSGYTECSMEVWV